MNITVNGQTKPISERTSLRDLVGQISRDPECVVAELNGAIVLKEDWIATPLKNGDAVELVTFVGGG